MPADTSRRTAWPNRRRCNSSSTAARRSPASSSSTERSAFRVTRKMWCSVMTMAGNRASRWAAMTCSSGTNRRPSVRATSRASRGGTFTRAMRSSSVAGLCTRTTRLRDRFEMYGNGWPWSTASGVRIGRIRRSKSSVR